MAELDMRVFSFSLGCVWSMGIFVLGAVSMVSRVALKIVESFSRVYIGYKATLLGSLIGAVWGFVDGALSGVLIAWIYNKFVS